ncbi:NAD(P)/FAD-dependent oxidoreductase [Bacillus sp. T33-2]|uniref:NAD(P)/FAD-dependent oxidoreductase n=1 Tax=Bacillus sp. T33-2 TaxID=2054168 RepID=UPI000C7684AC|nr:NAD(P)/FAD-dependent oxidoreductase [Bacillus sp. T33-2]PLR94473.1 NADH:flavin oxidoreductase [Bacillus sp. T33-2]
MSKLFTPLQIGPLTIKNRFMMAPMENGLAGDGGVVNERIILFFEERAKNEVGIILTGSVGVSPEGRGLPTQLSIYDDRFIPGLKQLTDAVHEAGSLIGAQLYHAGRQASEAITGIQPVAPSAVPCVIVGNDPREMTREEIAEMKEKFVQAARRSVEAGFDMIEVHFAHGYLLHSFMSPHSNKRTDEFGGSLENRMRFPIAVLKEIAEVCEGKAAVTIRISADEYLEDGLKFEEVITICQEAVKAGAQAISLSAGSYDSVQYTIQPMFINQGFLVPFSKKLKELVNVPVIVAGRLNSANLMEGIIEKEEADMLAIGRGLISDEELVIKMREQQYDDIRYCVACNQGCIDNVFQGKGITCLVNARAGFEAERNIEEAAEKQNVVIIGAGPAGMEAARVASLRGHNVTLIEREQTVGGKFDTLAAPPEKDTFLLYKDYLNGQLNKLGVKFVVEHITNASDLEKYQPNSIIIATGAHQTTPPIKGSNLPHVLLAEDVLNGKETGDTVAIIGGGLVGTETAKYLADAGKTVTIIEMADSIGRGVGPTFAGHLFEFIAERNVVQFVNAKILEITEGKIVLETGEVAAEHIVIAAGYAPNNSFIDEVKTAFRNVQTVGDVNQPRRIIDATEEGFLAAAMI